MNNDANDVNDNSHAQRDERRGKGEYQVRKYLYVSQNKGEVIRTVDVLRR